MTKPIKWTNDTVKLGDIDPWENNPRYSTEGQANLIAQSYQDFGQVDVFAVGPKVNGKHPLYNGHQRYFKWLADFGPEFEVDVRISSKPLDELEKRALTTYLHAGAVGSWNVPELANWGWDAKEWAAFGVDTDFTTALHNTAFEFEGLMAGGNGFNEDAFGNLPTEDRAPFQQMTFTLHDTQVEKVKEALSLAKNNDFSDTPNENSNGNALAFICEAFIDG